jgi:hypothetical protein
MEFSLRPRRIFLFLSFLVAMLAIGYILVMVSTLLVGRDFLLGNAP